MLCRSLFACCAQSVVDAVKEYDNWRFFFSNTPRQSGDTAMTTYLTSVGVGKSVGASFANLLISSECDYFVGILASNCNRLIDELKSTNGRMYAGYIALNADEW